MTNLPKPSFGSSVEAVIAAWKSRLPLTNHHAIQGWSLDSGTWQWQGVELYGAENVSRPGRSLARGRLATPHDWRQIERAIAMGWFQIEEREITRLATSRADIDQLGERRVLHQANGLPLYQSTDENRLP